MMSTSYQRTEILGFIGAKGGVGVSSLVANMALVLSRLGHRTLVVDGAGWGQGLFAYLGLDEIPALSLSQWHQRRTITLESLWVDTGHPGLFLLTGLQDAPVTETHEDFSTQPDLMPLLRNLDVRYILMDLGSSPTSLALDYWLHTDHQVLVTDPEPAGVANANLLLMRTFDRLMATNAKRHHVESLLQEAKDRISRERNPLPVQWLTYIIQRDPPRGERLLDRLKDSRVSVIVNRVKRGEDSQMIEDLLYLWRKHFGMRFNHMASVEEDGAVPAAARKRQSVVLMLPDSRYCDTIEMMARQVVHSSKVETGKRQKRQIRTETMDSVVAVEGDTYEKTPLDEGGE